MASPGRATVRRTPFVVRRDRQTAPDGAGQTETVGSSESGAREYLERPAFFVVPREGVHQQEERGYVPHRRADRAAEIEDGESPVVPRVVVAPAIGTRNAAQTQCAEDHTGSDAPFLISGTLSKGDTQKIDGLDGLQYLVSSELILFIQEKSSGDKIGSIEITGKGMDKDSEQAALDKSYQRLKISAKELVRTLGDASEKLKPIQLRLSKEALANGKRLFSSGDYNNALTSLAQVTEGETEASEAARLIEEIKTKLLEKRKEKAAENVETTD